MYCDWPALTRCCFCMPLRRGVLTFAYLDILFNGLRIAFYSFLISSKQIDDSMTTPPAFCLFMYCCDVVFNVVLVVGAHKRVAQYVKIYYYYSIATTVCSVVLGIIEISTTPAHRYFMVFEMVLIGLFGLVIQLYLLVLVSSLLKKLEAMGPHLYENQLHQFINGELKMESNGVYNPSTIPNNINTV